MTFDASEGIRERKSRETRERIFREAIALFERRGFAGTKIRDIAEHAGVSTVTVHNHFRTKDRFLHALAELYFERAMRLFEEMAQMASVPSMDVAALLAAAHDTVLAWPTTGRQLAADTQRVVLRTETGDRLYHQMRARLLAFFTELQRSGIVRSDLGATLLAAATGDLILGALTSWVTDLSEAQNPREKAAELLSFLLTILRDPSHSATAP